MNISYEIDTVQLEKNLDKFVNDKFKKLNKDVQSIAELIRDDVKENIFSQRKVPSGKLKDNAFSTIRKKGFNAPLIDTGLLYDSIAMNEVSDGYEIFVTGNRKDIALYNQNGTNRIPARPFFGIRTAIKKTIQTILNK